MNCIIRDAFESQCSAHVVIFQPEIMTYVPDAFSRQPPLLYYPGWGPIDSWRAKSYLWIDDDGRVRASDMPFYSADVVIYEFLETGTNNIFPRQLASDIGLKQLALALPALNLLIVYQELLTVCLELICGEGELGLQFFTHIFPRLAYPAECHARLPECRNNGDFD
jgi:hypothetical protein